MAGAQIRAYLLEKSRINADSNKRESTRTVDVRLPGKGSSNFHGARPVHLIITMIKWTRTSRLPIKNSLSWSGGGGANSGIPPREVADHRPQQGRTLVPRFLHAPQVARLSICRTYGGFQPSLIYDIWPHIRSRGSLPATRANAPSTFSTCSSGFEPAPIYDIWLLIYDIWPHMRHMNSYTTHGSRTLCTKYGFLTLIYDIWLSPLVYDIWLHIRHMALASGAVWLLRQGDRTQPPPPLRLLFGNVAPLVCSTPLLDG